MTAKPWRVGVVGITGAVGRAMVHSLAASTIPILSLRGFATARSAGTDLRIEGPWGSAIEVHELSEEALEGLDLVLLSAGAETSRRWVDRIVAKGSWAVDNSSAFRMDPAAALIVPEVNAASLPRHRGIVANPNCSTIQMVVVLSPLAQRFGLRKVHVATYQSVSGKGQKGIDALRRERRGEPAGNDAFPHPIDRNVIPQCDRFEGEGWTREEEKMIRETRRILGLPDLCVVPTCVRVPVEIGHGEAIHVELNRSVRREQIVACLEAAPGIRILDSPDDESYPMPIGAVGTDDVWVGRIRTDRGDPHIVALWVVADNLTKGAAANAVQIAALLHRQEARDGDLSPAR